MRDPRVIITAGELATVCARYDLGPIRSAQRLRGGSRASPKVLLRTDDRAYLLKRRTPLGPGREQELLERVGQSHRVLLHLARHGFPVPRLVGAREGNHSILRIGDSVYEVYEFVPGAPYRWRADQASAAGSALARCHAVLRTPPAPVDPAGPATPTFHANPAVLPAIAALPGVVGTAGPAIAGKLASAYQRAAEHAQALGVGAAARQLIHGDWHPGNVVFTPASREQGAEVAAVLDFEAARYAAGVVDLANGALQFAVQRRPLDPAAAARACAEAQVQAGLAGEWTGPHPDEESAGEPSGRAGETAAVAWTIDFHDRLFASFADGYLRSPAIRAESERIIGEHELRAIPALMVQALIVEAVAPVIATGRFGKLDALPVLRMVAERVAEIERREQHLVALLGGR